ncbi:hypothetical protein FDF11_16320 [Clostridium botulinum]|nr:hypothetical protein [Clostridium botulinum]NFR15271.1 hypothetical protein [Clostridium botulinum]NFR44538.1 hypothetical protein [Clostridium botulinum]NFS52185.1 hypothetical protein [Clostridium botulinum]
MEYREYIKKEAEILYNFILNDEEMFDNKKQIYARILNNIKDTVKCQIGGLEYLDISISEIKDIIKDVVNKY